MEDDDPITTALSSRRIPHGRYSEGRKGKGSNKPFDPLRALGRYDLQIGSGGSSRSGGGKRSRQKAGKGSSGTGNGTGPGPSSDMWLEIHELTEEEDGLIGTFSFEQIGCGRVSGMCVLAGSRKGLVGIIAEMERGADGEEEVDGEVDGEGEEEGREVVEAADDEEEEKSEEEDDPEPRNGSSSEDDDSDTPELPPPPQILNNRLRAFEKSSFRNPKFWMRWKAHHHAHNTSTNTQPEPPERQPTPITPPAVESNQAYLIFSSNDCERFEGTVSCVALGWDNAKLKGWKVRSRGSRCPVEWSDF